MKLKTISLLLLILGNINIYSQSRNVDSLSKSDFLRLIEVKNLPNKNTARSADYDTPSISNSQDLDTSRDLFQFNILKHTDVNKAVGKADIKIPIYKINFEGLSIPIEIVYNSGGIKADQFATEVGLGWSLNTGGEINKNIIKVNDARSKIQYAFTESKLYEFLHGYVANQTPTFSNARVFSDFKDLPDIYEVNFLDLNTSFYLDENLNPIQVTPYNGKKISIFYDRFETTFAKKYGFYKDYSGLGPGYLCPSNPSLTKLPEYVLGFYLGVKCNNLFLAYKDIQKINIINNHFTYDFNDFSVQVSSKSSDLGHITDSGNNYTSTYANDINRYVNKYNISTITDNLSKKKVIYSYVENAGLNKYARQSATFDVRRKGFNGDYQAPDSVEDALNIDYDIYIKKNISQIKTDNEIIDFEYINGREDSKSLDILLESSTNWQAYNNDPYLSKISIKDYKGNLKQVYVFNYSYFDSKCTDYNLTYNQEQCLRLKLNSIYKYSDAEMQNIMDYYIFDYYEEHILPKIGTFHTDPFGYKSPLAESQTSYLISNNEWEPIDYAIKNFGKKYINKRMPRRPNLYKYEENQGGFNLSYYSTLKIPALLPTKVNTNGYDQELASLEDSKTWSLKSIQYLTQGKQKLNYEMNNFIWKGQSILGGGIRISSIDLVDDNKTYTTYYEYSGGQIANLPMITNGKYFFYTNGSNTVNAISQNLYGKETIYNGNSVLYENVTQKLSNNAKIIDKYSTINSNPLKIIATNNSNGVKFDLYNYYFPLDSEIFLYMRKHPLIGNLLERYEYNDLNNLLKKTEYKYSLENKTFPIVQNVDIQYAPLYSQDGNIPYSFAFNYSNPVNVSIPAALYPTSIVGFGTFAPGEESKLYRNNLIETKTTEFFADKNIIKNKIVTYLDSRNLSKSIIEYSNNNEYKTEFLYPFEQGDQFNQQMSTDDNVSNMIVGYKKYKNERLIESNVNRYSYVNSVSTSPLNLVEKWQSYSQNDINKSYFSRYDNKNNIVESKNNVEMPTTYLWGYGQNLLLAKVEGATYAQVMEALSLDPNNSNSYLESDIIKKSNLHINDNTEQTLLESLGTFKKNSALRNYKISTFTYEPLVGISTVTDEIGLKTTYKRDAAHRLDKILDNDNNILKEYKYNFAPRIFYSNKQSKSILRTNCNPGSIPEPIIYTVPAGQYTSIIDQIDADQKAKNDIEANGQSYANTNGVCTPIFCSITPAYNISIYYSSFEATSANHIKGILSLPVSNTTNWSGTFIGTLGSLCTPNSYKNISVSSGDGSGTISIAPNGGVTVWISANSNSSSATFYFEYDK